MASSSSCAALDAPLTPTPPMICPSRATGIPPCKGVKNESGRAVIAVRPLFDDVFETFCGFLKQNRGPCFADGNVCARRERAVDPRESHQVAAGVHDCDYATWGLEFLGLCFRRRDNAFGAVECERLFFGSLPEGNGARQ